MTHARNHTGNQSAHLLLRQVKLQGHRPKLSQLGRKTMLLHTFPNNLWIELYGQIHGGITEETSIQKIIDKGDVPKPMPINSNGKRKNNKNQGKSSNPCRIPGHNHHDWWSECPKNRYPKQRKKQRTENKKNDAAGTITTTASNDHTKSFIQQHGGKAEHRQRAER
eukprot:jgi/Psemu1/27337/gm1.27337_g